LLEVVEDERKMGEKIILENDFWNFWEFLCKND